MDPSTDLGFGGGGDGGGGEAFPENFDKLVY